ncbi:baseplate wedge protein [Agrobacterium phage OLIVR5]|uniref:Baseplate wedge protein n=1 Tax=Agrobacterium phage OLIVR5 TaxID=2723773 RepID=A0A858MT42_9CAUD|nr:baseplate wedge subunit [Agrobacterium phage OLIVR5]QIW87768.1 baseplate wedge protein [Agrobacterium phage OLIVR5]QIW88032.1 baseplate wedge protein [Agrobacterium phage OLIVR6]
MAKIINQSKVDLSNSVLNSPLTGNPFYFFFGTIQPWKENLGILKITQGTETEIRLANPAVNVEVGTDVEIHGVEGMSQIDGVKAQITAVSSDYRNITINVNSTGFSEYTSGGYVAVYRNYMNETEVAEQIRSKIIGLKRVTGNMMCHVVKRFDWESGMSFVSYDPSEDLIDKPFYCYSEGNVYICLDNGKNMNSTIRPSGKSLRPQKYMDGYTWQYLLTVSSEDMEKFGSDEWLPVRPEDEFNVSSGSVISISIKNRGFNYDHMDKVRIIGDGEGAVAQIGRFLSGGQVLNIDLLKGGRGYTWADAWIEPTEGSTGDGALLSPVISPNRGKYTNPVNGLLAHNIRFVFELNGDESGELYVGPMRSIGMIRPQLDLYKTEFSKEFIDTRSWMDIQSDGQEFEIGDELAGLISKTRAICAGATETKLWFVEVQGQGFVEGEMITSGIKRAVSTKINNYDLSKVTDSNIIFAENFESEYMRNKDQLDRFVVTISY